MAAFWLFLSLGPTWAQATGKNQAGQCPILVAPSEVQIHAEGPGVMTVNGKAARVYPLAFTLKNLGLPANGNYSAVGNVALVGEGFGQLLPHILESNDAVLAIDLWYGESDFSDTNEMSRNMRAYIGEFAPWLVPGSAMKLPLQDQSQQLVLSHMLLLNLGSYENQFHALNEAARVLAPGGKAVFAYHGQGVATNSLKEALEAEWGENLRVSREVFASRLDFSDSHDIAPDRVADDAVDMTVHRLTIERIAP